MNILLVHNTYQQPGGEDVVFAQEHRMLENQGHRVHIYRRSNFEVNDFSGLRRIQLAQNTVWSYDTRKEFLGLLRAQQPDVVHVHNTFPMISPSIYSACYEARVPVVQTLHNYRLLCPAATLFRDGKVCEECISSTLLRSIEHRCYRKSQAATAATALMLVFHRMRGTWKRDISCYIALTNFSKNKFVEGGLPAERIFVKPNFVDPDPGARTGDGDYALFVGRLSPEKRVSTVLKAWKALRIAVPIRVLGGGPDQLDLEKQAAQDNLSNVRFHGQVPREETLAAINKARFLVFSSEWYENFPMTIAEAFACRTPVIASRLGAMAEIVGDGHSGLHFNPGDHEDLARKVEWAWTHPAEMRAMGENARKEYDTKYTAETNYPMLMEIYERAKAFRQSDSR
jgi:glycosyltransferase involved in cell wall biosynthesis